MRNPSSSWCRRCPTRLVRLFWPLVLERTLPLALKNERLLERTICHNFNKVEKSKTIDLQWTWILLWNYQREGKDREIVDRNDNDEEVRLNEQWQISKRRKRGKRWTFEHLQLSCSRAAIQFHLTMLIYIFFINLLFLCFPHLFISLLHDMKQKCLATELEQKLWHLFFSFRLNTLWIFCDLLIEAYCHCLTCCYYQSLPKISNNH